MTTEWAIVLLVGAGGLLQVVGVLLVVHGIRSDRSLAQEVLTPLIEPEHQPTYPEKFTERDKVTYELQHRIREETIRPTRLEARQQLASYDAVLRGFIRQQLTSDIGARLWGVGLIVAGVVLATTGGVWATVLSA